MNKAYRLLPITMNVKALARLRIRPLCAIIFHILLFFPSIVFCSPEDPHLARCGNWKRIPPSSLSSNTCSWFEGWYTRIIDHSNGFSFAVIVGTINSTEEAMITLLSCYDSESFSLKNTRHENPANFIYKEGEEILLKNASEMKELDKKLNSVHLSSSATASSITPSWNGCNIHSTQTLSKNSHVTVNGHEVWNDPDITEPPNFEWSEPNHGFLKVESNSTLLHFTVGEYSLKANISSPKLWKADDWSSGPEGWFVPVAEWIPLWPCRWHIHSLGSYATYEFVNSKKGEVLKGEGFAHQEKNWGDSFPEGHAWAQAISEDNSAQVVLSVAYFRFKGIDSPYVSVIGYRSSKFALDFRTIDPGTVFTGIQPNPCEGKMSIWAYTFSHTMYLQFESPPNSFGKPILAPTSDATWQPLCSESFSAVARVKVWKHSWFGEKFSSSALAETPPDESLVIGNAALEFGEGLLCN